MKSVIIEILNWQNIDETDRYQFFMQLEGLLSDWHLIGQVKK